MLFENDTALTPIVDEQEVVDASTVFSVFAFASNGGDQASQMYASVGGVIRGYLTDQECVDQARTSQCLSDQARARSKASA